MSKKESNPQPPGARPEPPPAPPGILTDNSEVIRTLEARIAELESRLAQREADCIHNIEEHARLGSRLGERITELEAENARLRELHRRNVHEDSHSRIMRSSHFCEWRTSFEAVIERSKAALLGGGENG